MRQRAPSLRDHRTIRVAEARFGTCCAKAGNWINVWANRSIHVRMTGLGLRSCSGVPGGVVWQ